METVFLALLLGAVSPPHTCCTTRIIYKRTETENNVLINLLNQSCTILFG